MSDTTPMLSDSQASLDAAEVRKLEAWQQAQAAGYSGPNRRATVRVPFNQIAAAVIDFMEADDRVEQHLVHTRDLSAAGLGFYHTAEVPVATPCVITLLDKQMQGVPLSAIVVRCARIQGILTTDVYDIGIRFAEEVDITAFVD